MKSPSERERILFALDKRIRETIASIEDAHEKHDISKWQTLGGKLIGLTLARAIVKESTT